MQQFDGSTVVSASDLTGYLACRHLTQLDLSVLRGELGKPHRHDPLLDVIVRLGIEHEARYLETLKANGLRVSAIKHPEAGLASLIEAREQTVAALADGVDVVYQATFFDGTWRGHADFLRRVPMPSKLGNYSYEIYDTKLARKAKATAVLQLCVYAELLEQEQGIAPESIHLRLGDESMQSFRLRDFSAYYRAVKSEFIASVGKSPLPTYPDPVEHCSICKWAVHCNSHRRKDRHLTFVADIRKDQIKKMNAGGVGTIDALATAHPEQPVTGISSTNFTRLQDQAAMQVERERTGISIHKLLDPPGPGLGLEALPSPSRGDLLFDIESDEYAEIGGLEYLFGWVDAADSYSYEARWAHDRTAEKKIFEDFIDLAISRFDAFPDMHIYHYSAYEPAALKRLMGRHATREDEVDRLLRGQVFVDLFRVVKQSIRISEENYSIKTMERFYGFQRKGDIGGGGSSIVEYERYLQTRDDEILKNLEIYNEADCQSLVGLRDWLEDRRSEAESRWGLLSRPELSTGELSDEAARTETQELMDSLCATVPDADEERTQEERGRWLLAQMLEWHRREEKSDWWAFYERQKNTASELLEDRETLAMLAFEQIDGQVKRSDLYRYSFPEQETKLDRGAKVIETRTGAGTGTVWRVDFDQRKVWIKRGRGWEGSHPEAIGPPGPPSTKPMRLALRRLATAAIDNGFGSPSPYQPALQLLMRQPPQVRVGVAGEDLVHPNESAKDAALRLAIDLENSCLPIQGPPGTGKTYTGARMITALLQSGRKVGITANSHKVISNLLEEVCEAAQEEGLKFKAVQKCSEDDEGCQLEPVTNEDDNAHFDDMASGDEYQVVAGTAWAMSRPALEGKLDVLFIDEAGQFSLANALAVATSAKNLVLLGDPQQLNQPTKGIHPEGAGTSALGHVLAGSETIAPDRGLFLEHTFRMHPNLTSYVSEAFYQGRLQSQEGCDRQEVRDALPPGIHLQTVPHEGNRIYSLEEAAAVAAICTDLLGRIWTDANGKEREICAEDLIVVAPFNAQVARLRAALPVGVPVGTVDKFQGQEGVVAIYSLTTSSPEDIPRNFEFLYSRHRLNVAVSRARSFAIVVCNPLMLLPMCRNPEQMRLANSLCLLKEHADQGMRSASPND